MGKTSPSSPRLLAIALTTFALAVAAWAEEESARPRADFEAFGGALDRALARVSRPAAGVWFPTGEPGSRGYHLQGYGAVFVPPARLLPMPSPQRRAEQDEAGRALDQAARRLEEAMRRVENGELRRRMETSLAALRDAQAEVRRSGAREQPPADPPGPAQNPNLEAELALELENQRAEAELAQNALERSVAEVERQLRVQLPALAAPAVPAAPAAPPAIPAAPDTPEPPLPPWRFWFEHEEGDGRSAERVIHDVSEAVADVLESHGPGLRWLKADEAVVVAVDFVPRLARPMFDLPGAPSRTRAERTLVVRVRKRELEARRDGKLGREELRKRIEYVQY